MVVRIPVFFLFLSIIISGCVKTVPLTLHSDTESTDKPYISRFRDKTGNDAFSIVFEYSPETSNLQTKDILWSVDQTLVKQMYADNGTLFEQAGRVKDCITVKFDADGSTMYQPCMTNKNADTLSLYNKNEFHAGTLISGTISVPFDILLTILGEPTNPYSGLNRLVIDKNLINRYGAAATAQLGREIDNSCKVSDRDVSAWYSGECKDSVANGQGTAIGRDRYVGSFVDGKKHGAGEYFWHNGDYYHGDYKQDQITGKGTFIWTFGDRYEGEFVNGDRTGHGIYTYKDGSVAEGFFLNNKLLTDAEYAEYRCSIDPEFAKQYRYQQYRDAFSTATSSADFRSFIDKYSANDPDGLVSLARTKMETARQQEIAAEKARKLRQYREDFAKATTSFDYDKFIETYAGDDPDNLITKAKSQQANALRQEQDDFNSLEKRDWSHGNFVEVTFHTAAKVAVTKLQGVKEAMKVRDPMGIFNPYWVPSIHAAAAYDNKGIVVGEWYTDGYTDYANWLDYLKRELNKAGITDYTASIVGRWESSSSASGGSAEDAKNACFGQFDGDYCFSIKDSNEKNACMAQHRGEDYCFAITDNNLKNACLAQRRGADYCFSITDNNMKNACLAQSNRSVDYCFSITDNNMKYACLAHFKGRDYCFSIK